MKRLWNLRGLHTFLIVVLAVTIRLIYLDGIEFKTDEGTALYLATRPLFGHPLPPGSTTSSIGVLNPPLFIYLLYPIVAISYDPRFVSAVIALANALAIGVYFRIFTTYYGATTAKIASLFMALSPWAIVYSRKIWPQDLLLPFFSLYIIAFHRLIIDKKSVWWGPYILVSLLLIELHISSLFFLVPVTIYLVMKVRWHTRAAVCGAFLGLLPLIAYVQFLWSQGLHGIIVSGSLHTNSEIMLTSLIKTVQLVGQGGIHGLLGVSENAEFVTTAGLPIMKYILLTSYPLLPLGMIVFGIRHPLTRILPITTLLIPTIYMLTKTPYHMHYGIITLPLLFLFLAESYTWMRSIRHLRMFASFLCAAVLLSMALYSLLFLKYTHTKGHMSGDYGTTYKALAPVHEKLRKSLHKLSIKDREEIVLTSYVPLDLLWGKSPLARMLYSSTDTRNALPKLEEKLKIQPYDIRLHHVLVAYYAEEFPTRILMQELRNKAKDAPGYDTIYTSIYSYYLGSNFLNSYRSPKYGTSVEYPRHWKLAENESGVITMLLDNATIQIIPEDNCTPDMCTNDLPKEKTFIEETTDHDTNASSSICSTADNEWCGTSIRSLRLGTKHYDVHMAPQTEQVTLAQYHQTLKPSLTALVLSLLDLNAPSSP